MIEQETPKESYNYRIGASTALRVKTKTYDLLPLCGYPDKFEIVSVTPETTPDKIWQINTITGDLEVITTNIAHAGTYLVKVRHNLQNYMKDSQLLPIERLFIVKLEDPNSSAFTVKTTPYFVLDSVTTSHKISMGQPW